MPSSDTPHEISQITDYLYISSWPEGEHFDEIVSSGIRLILSMHWWKPSSDLDRPPLRLLWLPTVDFPLTPMPLNTLRTGVEAALPVIANGGGVLTHCRAGVHRGVAMGACVLIGMGHRADEAMQLIKEKRPAADPDIWYIRNRIHKFETYWKEIRSQTA
jgi:hypothetical protein